MPPWVNGIDRSKYFHQGVGQGETVFEAEKRAVLELCASIHERAVKQVEIDFKRESGKLGAGEIEEDFRQWAEVYIEGKVPAEARVVDRWSNNEGRWAYAIVERSGMKRSIDRLYAESMSGLKMHAFVPGWAQFQQKRNRAAWTYLSGFSLGLITGVSGSVLASDNVSRRDRETSKTLREYYNDKANRYYWLAVAGYTLAGVTYATNVIDGLTVQVLPYEMLTSTSSPGVSLAFSF